MGFEIVDKNISNSKSSLKKTFTSICHKELFILRVKYVNSFVFENTKLNKFLCNWFGFF